MKRGILFVLLISFITIYSTDIKLKNGTFIKNVKITQETDKYYILQKQDQSTFKLNKSLISEVLKTEFNPEIETEIIKDFVSSEFYNNKPIGYSYEQRLYLLPITIIGIAYSYDLIDQISSLNELADITEISDQVKEQLTKKYVMLSLTAVATLVNTYFAFEKIKVHATANSVGLSYRF